MLGGREHEVGRILDLLAKPALPAGQIRVIQIDGAIGVGKSALLANAIAHAQVQANTPGATTPRVFLAHGDRLHAEAPLLALRVMIEELLAERLEDLLDSGTPAALGARCAEAFSTQGQGAVIVAVDDAQWLEPASTTFLTSLIQTPPAAALIVILVHRTGQEPTSVLAAASRRGAVHEHLHLGPLPDEVLDSLVTGVGPRQRAAVVDAARGNPLFARTAAAAFRRHPQADRVEQVLRLSEGNQTAVLSAAVAEDMAALTPPARRTLEALAVLGKPADARTIMQVADLSAADVESGVGELYERGLLTESAHEALHPVVRFSAYRNTDDQRRAAAHRRAAHLPQADLFESATHLAQVAPDITAGEAQVLIGAARVAISSEPGAVLDWLGNLVGEHRTLAASILLARALILTGKLTAVVELLRTLIVENPASTETRVLLANALRMSGETTEARALLAASADSVDGELLREYIDVVALLEGRAPESLISRLASLPGEVNRIVAAIYRTMDLLAEGRVQQARTTFRPVPSWLHRAGGQEVAGVLHAVACAAWAAYILDQFETGVWIAERGLHLARRYAQADVLPNLGTGLCFSLASLGLLDEADDAGERAIDDARRYGAPDLISMALAGLMIAAQGRADTALLQDRLEQLNQAPLPRFGWWRRAVLTTRTRVSAMLGNPVPCPELLGDPIDAMAALRYADAAAAAAALGEVDTARLLLAEGIEIAEKQDSQGQKAMVQTTHAEILLRSGDALQAGNLLRAAGSTFQRLGMRLQLGRAQAGIARADAMLTQQSDRLALLTDREREITVLVAQGLRNREIAARLVLSPRTPEYHIRNVMKKLGLSSREQIVALMHNGLPTGT